MIKSAYDVIKIRTTAIKEMLIASIIESQPLTNIPHIPERIADATIPKYKMFVASCFTELINDVYSRIGFVFASK